MRKILSILTNKNAEIVKAFLIITASLLYLPIYYLITDGLRETFRGNDVLYISRIFYLLICFIVLVFGALKFIRFSKRNMESLLLLGKNQLDCIGLFTCLHYEILFLMIYFGFMVFQIHEISMVVSVVMNAVVIYLLTIILALKSGSKLQSVGCFLIAGVLGIFIGTGKLTYQAVYQFIMSEKVKQFIFSENMVCFICKIIVAILLTVIAIGVIKKSDVQFSDKSYGYDRKRLGDTVHKLSHGFLNIRYCLGMYKSMDYVIWKIFSSVFFVFICFVIHQNILTMMSAYIICLITAFYFKDIYNFERKLQFFYFMSDYSYGNYLWELTITGACLLCDNVFIILFVHSMTCTGSWGAVVLTMIAAFLISGFVNLNLFSKYPEKKYTSSIFVILLKFHMPVVNIFLSYKNMKQGTDNWENMTYEYMR